MDDFANPAIYETLDACYLVASSLGIHCAAISRLPDVTTVGSVELAADAVGDGTETQERAVRATPQPGCPVGLLVIVGDLSAGLPSRFKFLDYAAIAVALEGHG